MASTDQFDAEKVQRENQGLQSRVSALRSELEILTDEVTSSQKRLKKVEYERDNAEGHVTNLKRDLDSLRKELYEERKKWKQEKDELTKAWQDAKHSSQSEGEHTSNLVNPDVDQEKDIKTVLEEAAAQAMNKNGFVYDERTGLYYDWNSRLYYDPNSCLYYDNETGIYYFYNEANGKYLFHSQIDLPVENENEKEQKESAKKKRKKEKEKKKKEKKASSGDDSSAGEIISSDEDDDDEDDNGNIHLVAPCIRAIVTDSDKLKIGTLFIITCSGGTLGREKDVGHCIRIPDVAVSKHHCRIAYDQQRRQYFISDLASRNGSFLNGKQLGLGNDEESDPEVLTHEDNLSVGGTTLALHIHPGNETCNDCEPGLVQARLNNDEVCITDVVMSRNSEDKRKKHLKNLKKAYGLEKEVYSESVDVPNKRKYRDRADLRRVKVGSDLPVEERDAAPSSVHRPISTDNKGRKMLEKMGWKHGEGLGKESAGLKEPITATIHEKSRGLGSGIKRSIEAAHSTRSSSSLILTKTRERYQQLMDNGTQISHTQTPRKKQTVFIPQVNKEVEKEEVNNM